MAEGLTADRLRELLDYDPATGTLRWRVNIRCGKGRILVRAGDVAGSITRGYQAIRVDGKLYLAHRLAWFWVHGTWPPHGIDHIDGDPSNNQLANLRLATQSENLQNQHRARSDNKSGVRGVHWNKWRNKWEVQLTLSGKCVYSSRHLTLEAAIAARLAAEMKFHPFTNVGSQT